MIGPESPLTMKQALFLSASAMLALAETLEKEGKESITVRDIKRRANAELAYFNEL